MAKVSKKDKTTRKAIAEKLEGVGNTSPSSLTAKAIVSPKKEVLGKEFSRTALTYGKKYLIRERIFMDTPKEYVQINRSKSPSVDIPDISPLRYDELRKRYDLGLSEDSLEFRTMSDSSKIKAILESRKDVYNACVNEFGKDFTSTGEESVAMNNFTINYQHDRVIDTSSPRNLIEVYCMLLGGKVAFKDELNEPKFKNATHIIECVDDVKSAQEQEAEEEFTLTAEWFPRLIKTDRDTLVAILSNINPSVRENATDAMLLKLFSVMVKDRNSRARLLDYATNPESVELLSYETLAKKAIKMRVLQLENSKYVLRGQTLGTTPHAVGAFISKPENKHIYDELVDATSR